ncbi:MAG: hypothetical protein AB8G23_05640 [Myxococcota bacterium]
MTSQAYRFSELDGTHPFKERVPGGFVDYPARRRSEGEVIYFNFALAREIGLIPADHPDRLTTALASEIERTFSFVIINEYDRLHPENYAADDVLPHTYMATRYLQLQHPGTQGFTSGDGRSVWVGSLENEGVTWDISSCGTGVTCLCPATGQGKTFFESGSATADYGCGTSTEEEGVSAALASEIFYANGIETERMLAVIATKNGQAINVRAGKNLLRPAHMFMYLRQGDRTRLEAVVDLFMERQIANGDWPTEYAIRKGTKAERAKRYGYLAERMATTFAQVTATFESEYIFCWLDWDGDNVLANGGIIDYGSIRQFGLYHRDYRFDDDPRWSTSIPEQKAKARHLVQCFAQIRDYLVDGERSALGGFRNDPVLDVFDQAFSAERDRLLLRNIGLTDSLQEFVLESCPEKLEAFRKAHAHFERAQSVRGLRECPDGLTHDAIFSTRDLLRELPRLYMEMDEPAAVDAERFMEICLTEYALPADQRLTPYRKRMASAFQNRYLDLLEAIAAGAGRSLAGLLEEVASRSSVINRFDRITGDLITHGTAELLRNRKRISKQAMYRVIERYTALQSQDPDVGEKLDPATPRLRNPDAKRVLDALIELQERYRHGL